MLTNKFQYKTHGRIFVRSEEDIAIVVDTIKEVDEFEASYMPQKLVAVYRPGESNDLTYLHKFEIDKIALTQACIAKGVWIWCIDGAREDLNVLTPYLPAFDASKGKDNG